MGGRLGQVTKAVAYTGVTADREYLLHRAAELLVKAGEKLKSF